MRTIIAGFFTSLVLVLGGCPVYEDYVGTEDDADDDAGDDDSLDPIDDDDRHVDEFIQVAAAAVDVLFVVDNSCSMQEEQAALQSNFWNFIQFFVDSGIDYHIGITVLDDWQGQPPIGQLYGSIPYIDETTPDPVGAFTGNMTMGDEGMGACEVGLEASYRALTTPLIGGYNAGFYREEAFLLLVIVTDEVDGSTTGCEAIAHPEYIDWLSTLKGAAGLEQVHFAAITGDYPGGCSSSWGDADPGHGYYQVTTALGVEHSSLYSICEQDWSPMMVNLSLEAAGAQQSFFLSHIPVPGTLEVFLDRDGDGPENEFLLTDDPTYQVPYSYVYDAASNAVVFSPATAPEEGAVIRALYEIQT
jgi:hypothetical protein